MALADSKEAIGAVSQLLSEQLADCTSAVTVKIGRPEKAPSPTSGKIFNLFLYHLEFDGQLKNVSLDNGQPTPLWLVLHYLLTAFDVDEESDSVGAHRLLGEGLLAMHELNYIRPPPKNLPLAANPEPLKVTFDVADAELISKIMQSSEDKYRISASVQVRPVMIAPSEPPSYAPAIKTIGPSGNEGVVVLPRMGPPSMGPRLKSMDPERFEVGQKVTLAGDDITKDFGEACIGAECVPLVFEIHSPPKFKVPATLSPGSYPVFIKRTLPSSREFRSNALLGHMLPTLNTVVKSGMKNDKGHVSGTLTLNGVRLGGPDDSIFVAFYRNKAVTMMLESTGIPLQNALSITVTTKSPIPAGIYRIILRVNGEQAQNSPEIDWSP